VTDSLVLTGAKIVLPDEVIEGTVVVEKGRITDISSRDTAVPGAFDLGGDYLLPGLIDLHTDALEKHILPRPGVRFNPTLAALALDAQIISSGITTVLDSICVGASIRNPERNETFGPMIEGVKTARDLGLMRADHLLHLRCEITDELVVEMFSRHAANPLLRLMSLMDHSPGQRQSPDLEKYKQKQLAYGMISRAEVDRLTDELIIAARTIGPTMRAALVELGRANGIPIASHDDATEEHIDLAKTEDVVISEFPTTLVAAQAARAQGMQILMGSPNIIRGGSHTGNVSAVDLAREGLLDIIGSDYVPVSLLLGAFSLTADSIGYALPKAIKTVTLNPAIAVGLDDRGSIAPGKRADLIRVGMFDQLPVVRSVWTAGRQVY